MPLEMESAEAHAFQAHKLLKEDDYSKAAAEAGKALEVLPVLAQAAIVRGQALLAPLLEQIMSEDKSKVPDPQEFKPAWEAFMLASRLEPGNEQAQHEMGAGQHRAKAELMLRGDALAAAHRLRGQLAAW